MKLEVRLEIPGQAPQSVELNESRMIVGTLLSNHIVLRAPEVEPIHALIETSEDDSNQWIIVDLGSESGVYLNGQRIEVEEKVNVGDTLRIGTATLQLFELSDESGTTVTPVPPPPVLADRDPTPAKPESQQTAHNKVDEFVPSYKDGDTTQESNAQRTVRSSSPSTDSERRVEKKDLLFSPRKAKPSGDYLECVAYWADTILDVDLFHADKKKIKSEVSIGDPTIADFIAGGSENVRHHVLAKVGSGGYNVYLRKGMDARIRRGGKVESARDEAKVKLGRRDIIHIKYGAVRYFLLFVTPPSLNLPRRAIRDPFFFGLSMAAALFYMLLLPVIVFSDPPIEKDTLDDEWQIVYVPEKQKKPEPVIQPKTPPKPEQKVVEKKTQPVKKMPPPPKPKPVKPAEAKKVKVVNQPKPVEKPVEKPKVNNEVGKSVANNTPPNPTPPTPVQKQTGAPGNKSAGLVSTMDKKPDFKIPGAKTNAPVGLSGGARGGGNSKAGAERKGNEKTSAMGVSDGKINKPSGRNLSSLGVGAGKVLSKIGPSAQYTNFKSDKGGAGRGSGSGRKTVGLGGAGQHGSVGLGGTSGAVNNFGAGYGGVGSGLGGTGGVGTGMGGRGTGSGGGGRARADVNVPSAPGIDGGGLTQQEILDVIKAHLNEIRHCYDRLLQRSPNSRGKIKAKWKIETDGRVGSASIVETTISDSTMQGCVTSRIKRWKFPKPRNNKPVDVTFPFSFVSSN